MEWTMDAFFADGGTTSFIDRLTASLGIHASTVKIVSVYEGSLIVNYEISVDDDDADALAAIQAKQDEVFSSGSINLGAPVLAYEAKAQIEVSTDTYTPVTISAPTYSQSNKNDPNVFNPDAKIITETQVTYKNNNVKVELENESSIKTETIIIESSPKTKVVTIAAEKDNKGIIIVAIALAILGLVLLLLFVRRMVFKPQQDMIELEKKIHRSMGAVGPDEEGVDKINKVYHGVERDSQLKDNTIALDNMV
jgi:hypothetical protein